MTPRTLTHRTRRAYVSTCRTLYALRVVAGLASLGWSVIAGLVLGAALAQRSVDYAAAFVAAERGGAA